MNILLCFNDKFLHLARTLIISLMCHHRDLHFYIGYIDLSQASRDGLRDLVEGACPTRFLPWDAGEFAKGDVHRTIDFVPFTPPANLNTFSHFGMDIWTRCFIWEQLRVDRLLYLDSDIVVNGNIERFYHDDLEDYLIKACPDYVCYGNSYGNVSWANRLAYLQKKHGYKNQFGHYCNTGVLLFNVAKMREAGITAFDLLQFYHGLNADLLYPDQDLLNLYFDGRIKLANPYLYNFEISPTSYMRPQDFSDFAGIDMSEAPYPSSAELDGLNSGAGAKYCPSKILIFHYSGAKPMKISYRHKFAEVFWHYHLMDPQETSKHVWTRVLQFCWGHVRRLIPDYPFASFTKRESVQETPATNCHDVT